MIATGRFAVIAAWAGEKNLAIEQLNAAIPLYGAALITNNGVAERKMNQPRRPTEQRGR